MFCQPGRVPRRLDLAEEAAHVAFAVAAQRWPRTGVPPSPGAWLTVTARNRALDRPRRERTLTAKARLLDAPTAGEDETHETTFTDERLELVFTCCHPALGLEAQVALTLRALGRLSTELVRRLGRTDEARTEYERALDLTHTEPERRFLRRRVAEASRSR